MTTKTPQETLFEGVVARISSSSPDSSSTGTDTKLRLYGLYKHCTVGPCPSEGGGFSWNPTDIAKRRAWQACQTMDKEEAMMEYAILAASQDEGCNQLLVDYKKRGEEGRKATVSSKNEVDTKIKEGKMEGKYLDDINTTMNNKDDEPKKSRNWLLVWFLFLLKNIICWIFGSVQPVIPRGGIDISWEDIWFALRSCLKCYLYSVSHRRQLEDELHLSIMEMWKDCASSSKHINKKKTDKGETPRSDDDQKVDVVVGYSVRSLLDLYLLHKQFPPQGGKEVVVVPPINIPGMVQILEHYGLVVVPVDTSPTQVDLDKVRDSISDKTVAILVVHPFGNNSLSPEEFTKLRHLADQHTLEIWEDAAESYQGIEKSTGSLHADVTFVSFGLIKTATALGGGIAILRDQQQHRQDQASDSADSMRRLQNHHYPYQTIWHYFYKKVMQAILIQFYSENPFFYGCFVRACLWWGGYSFLDRIVTRNLRSIVHPSDDKKMKDWLGLIRMRPCLPLLQLLHRRLCRSAGSARYVQCRVQQCREMTQALKDHAPSVGVLSETKNSSTHWLLPIQVDPDKKLSIQKDLLDQGWEVAAGTTQLQAVLPKSTSHHHAPTQVQEFMERVLYLPVPGRCFTRHQRNDLAKHVERVLSNSEQSNTKPPKARRSFFNAGMIASLSVSLLALGIANGRSLEVFFAVWALLSRTLSVLVSGFFCMATIACVLQWLGGSVVIKSSNAFAKHNSMLDSVGREYDETNNQGLHSKEQLNAGVIASMPTLKLPTATRQLEKGFEGCAILTGATGFVGSLLLRDLLLHRKALNIAGGVFVICRKKRNQSAQERIAQQLEDDMFSFLTAVERRELVHVLEGDVTQPNAGLSLQDMERLLSLPKRGRTVTHVIHSAASVSFTQTLPDAAQANITSALTMQALARRLDQCLEDNKNTRGLPPPNFVQISTAFVHGEEAGTQADPLPQSLFSLDPYDPAKLYESMMGTQFYASKAMNDFRFHNTYAFTKCVTEHLLLREDKMRKSRVRTLIIRPSIVGPALEYPHEGWAGSKPSTLVVGACLYLSYHWNIWSFGTSEVPCIPVDVLSRFVLKKAFEREALDAKSSSDSTFKASDSTVSSGEDSFERLSSVSSVVSVSRDTSRSDSFSSTRPDLCIYTAAWSDLSAATAMFRWYDYCSGMIQLGTTMGYLKRSIGYIQFWATFVILPRLKISLATYRLLHDHLVRGPMQVMQYLCRFLGRKNLGSKLSKLASILDLPLLFFPYTNEPFHFESELSAPQSMDGSRYMFSCMVAAHRFLTRINAKAHAGGKVTPRRLSYYVIGGQQHQDSINLWSALTQPRGNLIIRLVGWIFAKILKATCHSLSVDVASFEAVLTQRIEAAKAATGDESDQEVHLVLAPTHRSFFDFIILSYMAFAIPELHIDIPVIAAADDFESLPIVGWLARCLGAFYLRRGRGRADPELAKTITTMKQQGPTVFEVFVEGTRSRDRRFLAPKTGFLRSLSNSGGQHLIVPVSISYERLPEQDVLAKEASGIETKGSLNTGGLVRWLLDVANGNVYLGRIHVAAADPTLLNCKSSSDFADVVSTIQLKQQQIVYCSEYHVNAAAQLLKLEPQLVRTAMTRIGCRFWPESGTITSKVPLLPADPSELCTLMLQFGHHIAKLFPAKQNWCHWLSPSAVDSCLESDHHRLLQDPAVEKLSTCLLAIFADAESEIEIAFEKLTSNGFHQPNMNHLKMAAFKSVGDKDIPPVILTAAASMRHAQICAEDSLSETSCEIPVALGPQPLQESVENLGFWGFRDSGFALQVNRKGHQYVSMLGSRYSLSGKAMSKLLPFVAKQLKIEINPYNEAFKGSPRASDETSMESDLSDDMLKLLQATVAKMTLTVADRIRHGTGHCQEDVCAIRDASIRQGLRIPDAVVWPASENELESLINLAKEQRWCLIPFGGGTNVTQATRCPPKSIEPRPILAVDMTKMNRLLWLNEEDGLACFEAGINGRDLVETLDQRGYTMGHEPDSIEFSTLGGWVATKASGMKRNKYGNIEDIVREVRVAGASGTLWQKGDGQHQKSKPIFGREACGLDFKELVIGSEGCLGIVMSVVVKVWKKPEVKEYESVLFTSFERGIGFVRDTAKLDRLIPASIRLLDNEHFRLGQALQADPSSIREHLLKTIKSTLATKILGNLDPESVACATINYEGSKGEVELQKAEIQRLAKEHGGILLGSQVGKAGYDMTFMIAYLRDFALTYHILGESFETFVPWSKVPTVIRKTKERIRREHESRCLPGNPFVGARVTQLYHDGACLYFYFCMNTENVPDASRVYSEIEHVARSEILKQGGNLSHHHGVGKVRADFLKEMTTPEFKEILSSVKKSMDPDNIFAAGNGLFGSS